MPHRRTISAVIVTLLASLILQGFGQGVRAEEEPRSVRQIVEAKKNWPLWANAETDFVIQGHLGSRTNNELHMRHCQDLRFFFERPEMSLPRRTSGETMFKLSGHFSLRDGKPVFLVSKIESTSNFVKQHHSRRFSMNHRDPEEWRKLAAYTRAEAVFNKSEELHALARDAFEQACRKERNAKRQVTDDDMSGWIAQMEKFGVEERVLDAWEHDRLWMKWKSVKARDQAEEMLRFANEIGKTFPEARTPLETPQPKLNESYQQDPVELFANADADKRARLLRLFYMQVTRREILQSAKQDGSNADVILERLKGSLPDDPDLINHYEDLWLSWRFKNVPDAGREAAVALSRKFRELDQPERARQTLENWLEARLKSWRQEGARGYVRAAEEYLTLLEDHQTAFELLKTAWDLAPGEEDTRSALEELGYRLHNQDWITVGEFNKLPPDKHEEAIKRGQVLVGMTLTEVKRARGQAADVRTSVSAGYVAQAWVYGDPGTVREVVHLLRASKHPVDQARVIAIGELKPRVRESEEPAEETEPETDDD